MYSLYTRNHWSESRESTLREGSSCKRGFNAVFIGSTGGCTHCVWGTTGLEDLLVSVPSNRRDDDGIIVQGVGGG